MIGPVTIAIAKVMPKETPINAIALVRICSRVKSDNNAITAAEIAPLPCKARPIITPQIEVDKAAIILPITKMDNPKIIKVLRSTLSDHKPKGI